MPNSDFQNNLEAKIRLEFESPKVFADVERFWNNNLDLDGHEISDSWEVFVNMVSLEGNSGCVLDIEIVAESNCADYCLQQLVDDFVKNNYSSYIEYDIEVKETVS